MVLLSLLLLLGVKSSPAQWDRFKVTNVIPTDMSGEQDQNSEPSIAVSPCTGAPNMGILVSAFTFSPGVEPLFGGLEGYLFHSEESLDFGDITLEWNANAAFPVAYLAMLGFSGIEVRKSATCLGWPLDAPFEVMAGSTFSGLVDQPWVKVATVGGSDRIYVGFNHLHTGDGKSATVRYFGTDGASWKNIGIERLTPAAGNDSPAIRVAPANDGKTIYALFERWTGRNPVYNHRNRRADIVVVKEVNADGATLTFGALGVGEPTAGQGTLVVHNVAVPRTEGGGASLGNQLLSGQCSIAVDPNNPDLVYVAFTEVDGTSATSPGTPYVRVSRSTDGGYTFVGGYVYTTAADRPSSLPALAVAQNGTVGLLLTELFAGNLETHLIQAPNGNFNSFFTTDTTLASFPNNTPPKKCGDCDPYIGDYQDLEARGNRFFGVFSASNDPDPAHFPQGVFYQRRFFNGSFVTHDDWVTRAGELKDANPNPGVSISIDPFYFSTLAAAVPTISIRGPTRIPMLGELPKFDCVWPPQYRNWRLLRASSLDMNAGWSLVTNATTVTNDEVRIELPVTAQQQFFRLQKPTPFGTNYVETAAGAHGSIMPTGAVQVVAGQNLVLTAQPDPQYVVKSWYKDGTLAQSGGTNFTLTAVEDDHIVTVTFTPPYDLMATMASESHIAVGSNSVCTIMAANLGTVTATNVTITNSLPAGLRATGGNISQGSIVVTSNLVTASVGTLATDESATLTFDFFASSSGVFSNQCTVSSPGAEVNPTNNSMFFRTEALDAPVIVTQPHDVTIATGGSTNFTVSATGSPPLAYQWVFNDTNVIAGATSSTLTLVNISPSQAGSYSVLIFNEVADRETWGPVESVLAALTVQ